jgi:putative restriction endonuclease
LVCTYFPKDEWPGLCALIGLPSPSDGEAASDASYRSASKAELSGREARFRLSVVSLYGYTCALTGYRLMTISSGSIIDAPQLQQFAGSRNNDIRNGIALCKTAPWLFDNGRWTIADAYTVKVAVDTLSGDSPEQRPLSDYAGKPIRLPGDSAPYRGPAYLAWHRKQKFVGRR